MLASFEPHSVLERFGISRSQRSRMQDAKISINVRKIGKSHLLKHIFDNFNKKIFVHSLVVTAMTYKLAFVDASCHLVSIVLQYTSPGQLGVELLIALSLTRGVLSISLRRNMLLLAWYGGENTACSERCSRQDR